MKIVGIGVLVLGCVWGVFYMLQPEEAVRFAAHPGFLLRIQSDQSCEGCHRNIDPGMDNSARECPFSSQCGVCGLSW